MEKNYLDFLKQLIVYTRAENAFHVTRALFKYFLKKIAPVNSFFFLR